MAEVSQKKPELQLRSYSYSWSMAMARRKLLRLGALAAACAAAQQRKKILILGGTGFLGPATVEAAMARGHEITLFNRGRTRPGLFPGVEMVSRRSPDANGTP